MKSEKVRKVAVSSLITGGALAGAFLLTGPTAQAQGWRIDVGSNGGNTPSISGTSGWALTYASRLRGPLAGLGACGSNAFQGNLSYNTFSCYGFDGSRPNGQVVRNNAHSLASNRCYGATTWVYENAVGDYNWVGAYRWGTLNSVLANNEASAGRGNAC
ncbi:hypothetical protein [Actinomadura hibisca]|uniref:hypothetical protein n=1 Tax=Actinomadura hibisca TaxID=68565 RepID=UPI00082B09BB|nr:hypothetical protein [Actinomadura hibisca]